MHFLQAKDGDFAWNYPATVHEREREKERDSLFWVKHSDSSLDLTISLIAPAANNQITVKT